MTSTTSVHQEVLLPTLDQHFLSPNGNAHIRQHGSYSDNQDSNNTLQPLRDQHSQEPEQRLSAASSTRAQKQDSPHCCTRNCSKSGSCRTHEAADPPQWHQLHQQQQQRPVQAHLQQQYETARAPPSTQQDSWIAPGSRSSMEPHILSPSPLRPSPSSPLASSLSPCFPTPKRSVSPSLLSPSSPLLLSHLPCGHGYYCPCLSNSSLASQRQDVVVDTSSTCLTPSPSNSTFGRATTTATATAISLDLPHSDQPAISTTTPPPFPLTPELEQQRQQHAASSLTSLPSPPSSPTSPPFPLTSSSDFSCKTSQGTGLLAITTLPQIITSSPSCSCASSPSSSSSSESQYCFYCPDWQTSIAPKAQHSGPHPFPASLFTPSSPHALSPVSTTSRAIATATPHTPVPVATTVTITPTDATCRCPPEKLAFCPHQLSFLLPAANSLSPQAPSPPLSSSEIQPLRYFHPEPFNDDDNADNSQAIRNNYYNTDVSNDPSSLFPSDLESQVRNSLDYLRALETCPPSEQEAIKKSLTKRKKRPQSWIALKDFVSSRILGLHRERDSNNRQQECPTPSDRPTLLVLHSRNYSTPLLDHSHQRREFLLRSPSPSPSLPIASTRAHSTPNLFSRAASLLFRPKSSRWSEDSHQQQPSSARTGLSVFDPSTPSPSSLQNSYYRRSFGGHDSTRPSMRDWTTTSLASIRAPSSRATSPHPSTFAPSSPSPSSSPRSSSPPSHSYIPFQKSPRSDLASKAATFGPSTSFPQLQARFESTVSMSSAGSASTSSLSSYSHPHLPQPQSSTSMSNYTSSSMSSLSTISTTSNMSGPSPSNVSLHSTLPRSPLRKTTAGGQHPLATVSIFETDSMIITETAEGRETDTPEADIQPSREEQATDASSTLGDRNQVALEDYVSTLDDTRSDHPKAILLSARSQTGSSSQDKKQEDLRLLKSAVLSGSHNILMLQIKPGTQAMDPDLAAAAAGMNTNNQDANESDWASVSVASGDGQPLSPLTASYPASVHQTTTLSSTDSIDTPASMESEDTSRTVESPAPTPTTPTTTTPQTSGTATANTDPSPLPRHEFEKWTPPPPKPRPTQDVHRVQPQAHSRLHFPRLLKQRSFNFPFTTSSSSLSSSTSTSSSSLQQNGSATTPVTRASVDGSSQGAGLRADDQDAATRTASCDIPRSVGPPDPIPLHYQHLQNRQNRRSSSFRRRSHGGELERFSPGWAVVKNNSNQGSQTGGATTPTRISMSDDQVTTSPSSETHQRRSSATTSRRHASLGVQPNLTSMWGRLLTSILPSGNEQHHSQDSDTTPTRDREFSGAAFAMDGDVDPYLQQQRLLLTPLSQQQQIHPLYQQQLFFYADEVVSQPRRSELDPPSFQMVAGDTSESQPRRSMASDAPSHFPALAHNAHLQGELAQEDGRESLEMSSAEAAAFMRPSSEFSGPGPALVIGEGGETILAPRSLSADGKIPVSSLALSQPPSYWEAEIKYKGFPKIEPRPEQGNESLPRYTCSVFREGCVNRKTELVGNWRPYRRPWKRTFAHLRGTALRLYAVDIEDVPRLHVRNISLQLAKCEIATDYKQRPNVIRIRACDRTVLIECKDRIDALTWLEHLQAAANIATSLEDRSMPKFYTLPRAPPHSQYGQGQGQGGSRSAASSTARSSVVSNVSNRHHQQTPQPIPQPVPSSSSTYPQRRASMMPTVVSPRSSTEVDATGGEGAGADTERRVRRSRSGGLLTRSLRTTMTEQDRRNEAAAAVLGDEAMLRNVLRALGHTPDSGSPSTEDEEEIDSDNDEDDGQGTDAEASPAAAIVANQGVAAAARRRSGAGSRRCGGSCHHHHHRGHHYHDHNTTITVAAAPTTTAGDATMDGEVAGGRGGLFDRRSEDHSDLDTTTTHGYQHGQPVTAAAASSAQTISQRQQRASWNRRFFGGLWGSHQYGQHQQHPHDPSPDLHHQHTANNSTPLTMAAAT